MKAIYREGSLCSFRLRAHSARVSVIIHQENARRSHHNYEVNELIYVRYYNGPSDKGQEIWKGPYKILKVHTNGTVTIEIGEVHDRMSIRRIKPSGLPP